VSRDANSLDASQACDEKARGKAQRWFMDMLGSEEPRPCPQGTARRLEFEAVSPSSNRHMPAGGRQDSSRPRVIEEDLPHLYLRKRHERRLRRWKKTLYISVRKRHQPGGLIHASGRSNNQFQPGKPAPAPKAVI